jgi:hypothetical protein
MTRPWTFQLSIVCPNAVGPVRPEASRRPGGRAQRAVLAAVVCLAASAGASAQASRFDGDWQVTMNCPPHNVSDDDAKGYTHRFPARVVDGVFTGTHGKDGEPGWHFLRGAIKPDGDAVLRLDGIVNNPRYAIHDAPQGKLYSYRVKAHFEAAAGSGQRLTGRVCTFQFTR